MKKNIFSVLLLITAAVCQINAAPPADTVTSVPTDSSQQIADVIVNSKIPVLVDFWAVWCAPCRLLNPIVKELEKDFKGKVLFLKVNVDVHRGLAQYFSVSAIPTIFIINDKTVVKAFPGLQTKEIYAAALNEVLATAAAAKKVPAPVPAK